MKPCERAWCIDRVQGHRLQGHTRRTMNASSRQHCLELCLGERDFLCRWVWEQRLFFRLPRRESYSTRGKGERRGRRRSFSADLVPFSPWPRPGKISARGEKELRKRGVDALEIRRESIQSLSLSSPPLLFVLSENRRLHAPLRFPVIGFLELERRGKGTVTSRSYRVSSVSWSWGGRCFVRGERGERERNSRRPGQRFRSTVGLFTGLFSRSLCYFI